MDGSLVHADEKQASRWYLFTQVTEDEQRPGRKTPDEVGRQGLYNEIADTYSKVFKPGHPCHTGPEFGKVAQEGGHPNSPVAVLKKTHNHAACQFRAEHKWKAVEKYLREVKGIKVHISKHPCYRTMFDYISTPSAKKPQGEIDADAWTSPGHPPAEELPRPDPKLTAMWAARARGKQAGTKDESMKILDFYDLVRGEAADARSEDALWKLATEKQDSGDRRLMQFMLGRRDLPQLLERIGKAEAAPQTAQRACKTRLQILSDVSDNGSCTCTECGRWRRAADEVVRLNNYNNQELQTAILEALELGRAKQRNIVIVGDTNRAKSFCLKPLGLVFRVFKTPDSGSHQLADIKGSEVVWFNEFEYDPSFLPWKKMKDFLEGESLKVAVPKTHGANYTFDSDAPVFGTAPGPIEHPRLQKETEQMMSRIRYFVFEHFFDPAVCPDIQPCAHCFAGWIMAAVLRPRGPPGAPHPKLQSYLAKNRSQDSAPRNAWYVQKPPGTYQYSDFQGCFACGDPNHFVKDCPGQGQASGSAGNGFCGRCGAARASSTDSFCQRCGQRF